jgi:hypothetical protein
MVHCEPVSSTNEAANDTCSERSNTSGSGGQANKKMDKSSILRSTIDFLRLYSESKKSTEAMLEGEESDMDSGENDGEEGWKPSFLSHEEFAHLMLEVSRSD